jgi:hypothetical protein
MKTNQNTLLVAFAVTCQIISNSGSVSASDFRPSRVRLVMIANQEFSDKISLRTDFIPAGNLLGELAPVAFIGPSYKPGDWLTLIAMTGWSYKANEPGFSFRIAPNSKNVWLFADIELYTPSKDGYYFAQTEYSISKALHFGIEAEGWGNYFAGDWSHGAGPNTLLRFGDHVGLDLAIQIRQQDSQIKPEFVTRFLVFL